MLEVERKFTVPPEFVIPDLAAQGWVVANGKTADLDATYYDTEDLRLARARITLRRRVGGKDGGWHLKLPAGGEREEIQRPLGRGRNVPQDLADLVLANTRGLALSPVARIRTTRSLTTVTGTDGTPLVEVADDEVIGERLGGALEVTSWREVEVEMLTAGSEKALAAVGKKLRRAGATVSPSASKLARTLGGPETVQTVQAVPAAADDSPGGPADPDRSSAGAAVTAYLAGQVDALVTADPMVRRDADDAVHAMRVASRRLRSALRTFRPLLDRAALGGIESELKWLAAVLGDARDLEVLGDRLRRQLDALPAEQVLGPVRARLLDEELLGGQLRAQAEVLTVLRGSRYLSLLDGLDALAAAPPLTAAADQPASVVLPRLARVAWNRLDRRAGRALQSGADEDLHECRKAAKQARYTAEAVTPVLGRPAARLGEQAKTVQTVLGEHHDAVVARTLLRRLGTTESQAFTYGLLYAGENARAEAAAAQFTEIWRRADRDARRRLLKQLRRSRGA